jgi:hypothetical protein
MAQEFLDRAGIMNGFEKMSGSTDSDVVHAHIMPSQRWQEVQATASGGTIFRLHGVLCGFGGHARHLTRMWCSQSPLGTLAIEPYC